MVRPTKDNYYNHCGVPNCVYLKFNKQTSKLEVWLIQRDLRNVITLTCKNSYLKIVQNMTKKDKMGQLEHLARIELAYL